jgi:hypothetical protein
MSALCTGCPLYFALDGHDRRRFVAAASNCGSVDLLIGRSLFRIAFDEGMSFLLPIVEIHQDNREISEANAPGGAYDSASYQSVAALRKGYGGNVSPCPLWVKSRHRGASR